MTGAEFLAAAASLLERGADEVFLHGDDGIIFAVLLPLRTYNEQVTETDYHLRAIHHHLGPDEPMPGDA